MKNRIYVKINLFESILFEPDFENETLTETKRFYNTVSYGGLKTHQLVHHPSDPLYLNHNYQSVFDISRGFLGNKLSTEDISVWFTNILYEEVKDYNKIYLLFEFYDGFTVDNQLERTRQELISRKQNWTKSNVLLWDWNRIKNSIEIVKISRKYNSGNKDELLIGNDKHISHNDNMTLLELNPQESHKILNQLLVNSGLYEEHLFSDSQIYAIEDAISSDRFRPFAYEYRDYMISFNEELVSLIKDAISKKLKVAFNIDNAPNGNNKELLYLGDSPIIKEILVSCLNPKDLYETPLTNKDKLYYLLNMGEFNKSLLLHKIFERYMRQLKRFHRLSLEMKFGSLHNIIMLTSYLSGPKGFITLDQLIEEQVDLSKYRIGKNKLF
jgi:hypothetical protein